MKEKDIVDFTKFKKDEDDELIDENGNQVGCEICYTHEKAYKYFIEMNNVGITVFDVLQSLNYKSEMENIDVVPLHLTGMKLK